MELDYLDENTLKMNRDELLIELNDQIEITASIMCLDREEISEWRSESRKHQQSASRWRWSCYALLLILLIIAILI